MDRIFGQFSFDVINRTYGKQAEQRYSTVHTFHGRPSQIDPTLKSSYLCGVSRWFSTACFAAFLLGESLAAAPQFEPSDIHLQSPGASQRFLLVGAFDCVFSSDDQDVVTVEPDRLIGRRQGTAMVRAACEGQSAEMPVWVGEGGSEVEISFERDLVSIFTTKGCNGSVCHGSPVGQNGFKLSLYGSDAAADYDMVVHKHGGRRLSLNTPRDSLLLAKPSFKVAHGGGHLMTEESDAYRTILNWVQQGAKYGAAGTRLQKLEIYPREPVLVGPGVSQPVVAIGRLSDGTTRDMTDEVRYAVDDIGVVSDVEGGTVVSKGRGLTTVMARAMGKVATSLFVVIDEAADATYRQPEPRNVIDVHVFRKLREVNIEPFGLTDDRTFVRRVFLDAIGMLPDVDETEAFVASANPEKRQALIDVLLHREEYSTHWLVRFEDWFRNSQYYSQGRTNGSYKRWLHDLVREDRPYDEAVREMLTAVGDTTVRPAGNFWHPAIDFMLKKFEIEKAVPTVTRLFLGKRIECAQCHNHPLENLTQDDFYGMAAFLARTKVKHGYGQYRRTWYNERRGEVIHPLTHATVAPKFLGGKQPEIPEGVDRRTVLADWITRDQKLQFASATVNRIWYEYFGRGMVEPFDDFRSTNRATHPELLDDLARSFIDSGFRFKPIHRLILNSKTYQMRAHAEDRVGGKDPLEDMLFARYVPRKLPAEVLLDTISQVTGIDEEFDNYPKGTSPKELIASIGTPYFLTTFGHPRRDIMEARASQPSLNQALHLMNGDVLWERLSAKENVLSECLDRGLNDSAIVDRLYLRAYSRRPDLDERSAIDQYLATETRAGRERHRSLENVLWAILNAKEFQLNH